MEKRSCFLCSLVVFGMILLLLPSVTARNQADEEQIWESFKAWILKNPAAANAKKAGTRISTVKTSYQDFDFGSKQWDLIVMILSWAPVSDPAFVARLHASLRPGGVVVFEHVLETEKQSFPPIVHGLSPNALLSHFKSFRIQKYEEGVCAGDWGGPPAELVRMIARKK